MGIKSKKFNADFEFIEKVSKTFTRKKLGPRTFLYKMGNHKVPTLLCKFFVKLVCNFFNRFKSPISAFFLYPL
jgi:hypothetical protein